MSDHYTAAEFIKAARIMALAAQLNATVSGMNAENQQRSVNGESPAYRGDAFETAISESGCYHNNICMIQQGQS